MKKQKALYSIVTEDVINVANQENIPFTEKDLPFIKEKIEDCFGDKWRDAIQFALLTFAQIIGIWPCPILERDKE